MRISIKSIFLGVAVLFGLMTTFSGVYTVSEGHIGVITRFSEAITQVSPGLNWKIPFVDGVTELEVRERKNVEELSASTSNRLPITAKVSVNWSLNPDDSLSFYKRYRTLGQFEERVLDRLLRKAGKTNIAKYDAVDLIKNREVTTAAIEADIRDLSANYPISIVSVQIENITLPPAYLESVEAKLKAKEASLKEKYNLAKQKLVAQQDVQTAEAQRDARKVKADGTAYKIKTVAEAEANAIIVKGQAEAKAIKAVNVALSENSQAVIDLQKAKTWDGKLPTQMIPGTTVPFLSVK